MAMKMYGSEKYNWKVCWLPTQWPFAVEIKENFAKGVSVYSLYDNIVSFFSF